MQQAKMQSLLITMIMAAVCMDSAASIPISQPETPRNSTPCSIQVETICSAIDATDNFSMKLGADNFHKTGEISIQVHATQCVLSNAQLPWWYQIEVVEMLDSMDSGSGDLDQQGTGGSGVEDRAGRFSIPRRRKLELTLCNQHSTLVFSSCSPTLLDLPREITWMSPNKYSDRDSLCFRLTVQLSGDSSCSQKEVCISIGDIPRPVQNTEVTDDSQDDTITYIQVIAELEGDNTLGSAILEQVDEFAQGMDDEDMLELIREKYGIDDSTELGVSVPAIKGCLLAQDFYAKNDLPWTPDCTCEGYYKAIQCIEVEAGRQCWCSSPGGSEIVNSRRTLNCTNPHSFEFKC